MSAYHSKVLELVAIEKSNEKSYIRLKLSFEQEVELSWEIDSDTAENLINATDFDRHHKYRLSLHTAWYPNKNQFCSFLSRTYRDISERIYFACSVDYQNNLESIKNTQNIEHLQKLPFLSIHLSATEQKDSVIQTGYKPPFKWVKVPMLSIVFFILLGYSSNPSMDQAETNRTTIATVEVASAQTHLKNKKTVMVPPVTTIAEAESSQSSLPVIELDDFITYSVPKGYVSLTFDDGPSAYTNKIVDILKEYEVGGTFFFIGKNVEKHPDSVRYVQSNGYSIGSHSMNHVLLSDLSYEKLEHELIQSIKAIEEITNEESVLFRPPYGAYNELTKDVTHEYHQKLVLWNRDPRDWNTSDADKIFDYVRDTESSGSIILLHESQTTIDALPKIIEHLQKQSLEIVGLR